MFSNSHEKWANCYDTVSDAYEDMYVYLQFEYMHRKCLYLLHYNTYILSVWHILVNICH